jgi:hypothetical protein
MRWIRLLVLAVIVGSAGCTQAEAPAMQRIAVVDGAKLDSIALQVKEVASRRGMRVFEKPRADMRALNRGVDAIFLALYIDDEQVLVVTNVGHGNKLLLAVTPKPGFPAARADELINEVADQLEEFAGVAFPD